MSNFTTCFNSFINQRLENNIKELRKNKNYKKIEFNFFKLEDEILSKSSTEEKERLNTLLSYLYDMQTEENFLAYKLGFYDGMNFNKYMKNN